MFASMWRRLIYHPEINYALRQTLVLCLPVAVGLLIGQLHLGLLFSLVPACCNIAGLDTPHKRFFKRLIIGASLRMRKRSPPVCACWRMTFFIIVCRRASPWKNRLALWRKSPISILKIR
ncbi:hypothetical protein SeGA_4683 [Salmonella enterica subsp. enterica serovar Gaminara str. A4-567]|nr:hypothetical protein SeGA_4683 [Salmonella enterica subsp. enterica serovar Gaminara str. A4-567]